MFTGIIQAIGKVVKYDSRRAPHNRRASAEPSGGRFWISVPFQKIHLGESIAVDGVCLTVAGKQKRLLGFDVGRETRGVTTLPVMWRLPIPSTGLHSGLRLAPETGPLRYGRPAGYVSSVV